LPTSLSKHGPTSHDHACAVADARSLLLQEAHAVAVDQVAAALQHHLLLLAGVRDQQLLLLLHGLLHGLLLLLLPLHDKALLAHANRCGASHTLHALQL
jgi:hypothetical protein